MRKLIIFAICVLSIFCLSAETPQTSWKVLEQATRALDEDDPGSALRYAEIAKELRKTECQEKINILESAIIPLPVQQVGDLIPDVLYVLESRNSYDAINLINELLEQKGSSFFSNSISNMQSYLEKFLEYPEADHLIGKVYMYEGEYNIAKEYYLKALDNFNILDIPDTQFDIRYDLAFLASIQLDDKLYEEALLSIVEYSDFYSSQSNNYSYSKACVKAAIDSKVADKYFLLYRINSTKFIPAYLKLAKFYDKQGFTEKSFFSSTLGVLASFTRINDILTLRNYDYEYKNLDNFFELALSYSDINNWLLDNDIWDGILLFANYVFEQENTKLAEELYMCIKKYCPMNSVKNLIK